MENVSGTGLLEEKCSQVTVLLEGPPTGALSRIPGKDTGPERPDVDEAGTREGFLEKEAWPLQLVLSAPEQRSQGHTCLSDGVLRQASTKLRRLGSDTGSELCRLC